MQARFPEQAVEGRAIIGLAKGWRLARNNKGDAQLGSACLSRMVATIDYMTSRDREEGRSTAMTLGYSEWLIKNTDGYMDASSTIRWARENAEPQAAEIEAPQAAAAPAADPLAALRAKLADEATGNNERAILQAALEVMQAGA